jgi:nitroreductase/NAD-dependent dihydropyrimidine dehydrogenase PreA subunit
MANMFELNVSDDCTRCGLCVADCPGSVLAMEPGDKPVAASPDTCINCQHCMAICPVGALAINGISPANSVPVSSRDLPSSDQMDLLLRARRSIRQYEDEPVDPELITELLETTAHAPTGCNHQGLSFHIISDPDTMKTFVAEAMDGLVEMASQDGFPPEMDLFKGIADRWTETGSSRIFRDAPHMLIVSSDAESPCGQEDVIIALSYFELLAQSHGLGTTWCGLAKALIGLMPQFKKTLQLDGAVGYYYPMLFGWPAIGYPRTVQRNSAATVINIR